MLRAILKKRWIWILSGCVCFVILVLLLLPEGIQFGIKKWLLTQEGEEVRIEDVDFNPFSGRLKIANLRAQVRGEAQFNIDEMILNYDWSPLLKKRLYARDLLIRGADVTLMEIGDGRWRLGAVATPEKTAPEDIEPEMRTKAPWQIASLHLEILDAQIKVISSKLTGTIQIKRLELDRAISWDPEKPARLLLDALVEDSPFHCELQAWPFAPSPKIEGKIQLTGLGLTLFRTLAAPFARDLKGILSVDTSIQAVKTNDSKIDVSIKGPVGLREVSLTAAGMAILQKDLAWDGKIKASIILPGTDLKACAEGLLKGAGLNVDGSANYAVKLDTQSLSWKGQVDFEQPKGRPLARAKGVLAIEGVRFQTAAQELTEDALKWEGEVEAKLAYQEEPMALQANGQLDLGETAINWPSGNIQGRFADLTWQGNLNHDGSAVPQGGRLAGDLNVRNITLTATDPKLKLMALEAMRIKGIQGDISTDIQVSGIGLENLDILQEPASTAQPSESTRLPLCQSAAITLKDIHVKPVEQVAIDTVTLSSLQLFLRRLADGKFYLLTDLQKFLASLQAGQGSPTKASAEKPQDDAQAKEPPVLPVQLRIGKITLADASFAQFEDQSVQPQLLKKLVFTNVSLKDINSQDPTHPSPFEFEGQLDKYTKLAARGLLYPFAQRPTLDLTGDIEGLEMIPLSPYALKPMGYEFTSGELNADIQLKIDQGEMRGLNKLLLSNLEVKPLDRKRAETRPSGLPVPLGTALDLLKDKKNQIRLKVPVRGDITAPDIGILDVINTAVIKAIGKAATGYLVYALQPFGTIIAAGQLAADAMSKVYLSPITFAPGTTDLDSTPRNYLAKVAKVLKDRPAIRIRLCGKAVEADRAALAAQKQLAAGGQPAQAGTVQPSPATPEQAVQVTDRELLDLAQARENALEDFLVEQHGIAANRLITCRPEIARGAGAKPRVELSL